MTGTLVALIGIGALAATAPVSAAVTKVPKPCSLLGPSEVAGIVRREVNAGKPRNSPVRPKGLKVARCEWASTDKTSPVRLEVDVFSGKNADKFFERNKKYAQQNDAESFTALPNLGKDAFYYVSYNGTTVLLSRTRVLYVGLDPESAIPLEADFTTYWQDVAVAGAELAAPRAQKG
jgi:hypothetical protein